MHLRCCRAAAALVLLCAGAAAARGDLADGSSGPRPLVIDTDAGLDDMVALALALQTPRLHVVAITLVHGVAGAAKGARFVERLLGHFGRRDIPVYLPAPTKPAAAPSPGGTPPPFRAAVERTLDAHLPARRGRATLRPFSPDLYAARGGKRIAILALGPLTNIAHALKRHPRARAGIAAVLFRGAPAASDSWNVRFHPQALVDVRAAGVPLYFVRSGQVHKSLGWLRRTLASGSNVAAISLLRQLLGKPAVREHYLAELPRFTDELAVLAAIQPALFTRRAAGGDGAVLLEPRAGEPIRRQLTALLRAPPAPEHAPGRAAR